MMWRCPLCQSPLNINPTNWYCANNHSFDVARAGYVNLLPVQQKNSLQPGDNKAMLRGRRAFHSENGFSPLVESIVQLISDHRLDSNTHINLYDAGCGEGSYLANCSRLLAETGVEPILAGSDISKIAVEMAAKAVRDAQIVVASSYSLPVNDNTQDVILQVFAPGDPVEFARALKPGGILITAEPGPRHLWELKQSVYAQPELHQQSGEDKPGMLRVSRRTVTFNLEFSSEAQQQGLFSMTPYVWRLDEDKKAQLSRELTSVTADFIISVWQKPQEKYHEQ